MTGWRPALLIAWRDALRAKGRTALVLVMIALPVLGVTAAAIVIKTAEVKGLERADRELGTADARILTEGRGRVLQGADPEDEGWSYLDSVEAGDYPGAEEYDVVLGSGRPLTPIFEGFTSFVQDKQRISMKVTEVDLSDSLAQGLFELTSGALPNGPDEVVVTDALIARGVTIGDRLDVDGADISPVVVGIGRDATERDMPAALGPIGSLGVSDDAGHSWLIGGGPVSWSQVRELNQVGFVVTSRAVLADPPDLASMAEQMGYDTGQDEIFAVVALVIVMALLEVVLLAGPAFAVGARRQSRALALMSATGATPRQARRVVLASGIVLGLMASAIGVVLGVVVGWAVLPLVQRYDDRWFGPFEIPLLWLAGIALFGLASAFLAAVVPAWIASRQDVVAVLAGRRGDRRPSLRSPLLGLVMLGVGIVGSSFGAATSDSGNGALWIAACAVISVLGMILLVPLVVSAIAKVSGRLPLTPRYAARDAARHRTRTVPAVAAVAATVAGVVALGIANASDERENEATYTPQFAMGNGIVSWTPETLQGDDPVDPESVWANLESVVRTAAPEVDVVAVRGIPHQDGESGFLNLMVSLPGASQQLILLQAFNGLGTQMLVGEDASALGLDDDATATANAALRDGRAVVMTSEPVDADEVRLDVEVWRGDDSEPERTPTVIVPAVYITAPDGISTTQGAVPQSVADELGVPVTTASLLLRGEVSTDEETAIEEAVRGAVGDSYVYIERGYQRPAEATIILLVLFTLGGVLMLGGTLTATFLALSDARPDLATLAAVGAAPRTRRAVAAAYALVIGFVGALLGAGVGFIPGIAISRPLTSFSDSGPYLDIPWLLIVGLVIVLPLLTAAIVGLSARSRLPLVARLD